MLALRVEYLTGRCVATSYSDRAVAEWPPHPARVYSALVATWADAEVPNDDERLALDWLARQAAPSVAASGKVARSVVQHFVPVNDITVLRTFSTEKLTRLESDLKQATEQLESLGGPADEKETAHARKKAQTALHALRKEQSKLDQQKREDATLVDSFSREGLNNARAILPESRLRQARFFPSVTPDDPVVYFMWSAKASPEIRRALDGLAARVVRIGHSSSLVSCCFASDAPAPVLVPMEEGETSMRVPRPDQFPLLREAYAVHREVEPRVLAAHHVRYGRPRDAEVKPLASTFTDRWTVFHQISGRRLPATRGVEMARVFRDALMSYCDDPPPELVSGHKKSGAPSDSAHLAIVPLPFVGHLHASGSILGVALIIPRATEAAERSALLRGLAKWEAAVRKRVHDPELETPPLDLTMGAAGIIQIERVEWGPPRLANLRSHTWCRTSRTWLSVTPVALDRNPGNLSAKDPRASARAFEATAECIVTACERIGLPKPSRVEVLPSVTMPGVEKARAFPPFPEDSSRPRRVKVHAFLEFTSPVRGPVLLGAGRYFGLGLFRPVDGNGDSE